MFIEFNAVCLIGIQLLPLLLILQPSFLVLSKSFSDPGKLRMEALRVPLVAAKPH
jgi:hypothetical protein